VDLRRADGSVIAVEVVGDQDATPVLLCHGLADSRLSARWFEHVARQQGVRIIAPDRPGIGGTDPWRLSRLVDWVADATRVLDELQLGTAALLGVSAGGPFAAACAATIPGRVRSLTLVSPFGRPEWPTAGMVTAQRLSLVLAGHAPGFSGWSLGRFAALARRSPQLFLRLTGTALADADTRVLRQPAPRESFLTSYLEAFRQGSWGTAQDLRVLTQPWGFDLASIRIPTLIRHGDADLTVPIRHAELYAQAIPGARLDVRPGHGHFSILGEDREILAEIAQ
jgi:pimeloyl-ACP methyl ester carboxylesterase